MFTVPQIFITEPIDGSLCVLRSRQPQALAPSISSQGNACGDRESVRQLIYLPLQGGSFPVSQGVPFGDQQKLPERNERELLYARPTQIFTSTFFKRFIYFYLMYAGVSPVYTLCEGVGSPRTRIIHSCELPCGCWELNPGPLEEQPMLINC